MIFQPRPFRGAGWRACKAKRKGMATGIMHTRLHLVPAGSRASLAGLVRPRVNPAKQRYSFLPKFGNSVCVAYPGSISRGDHEVVIVASRACGGRGSVGMKGAGRAGSPCELVTACGRAALLGFVSSVSFRLCRRSWENCGEMAGRAYGKTVWSWPSLLRPSSRECGIGVNRRGAGDFCEGEGGQRELGSRESTA
ncbi:hypothetical protein ABIA45_003886 [Bradyrhizobium sp. USDA 336]